MGNNEILLEKTSSALFGEIKLCGNAQVLLNDVKQRKVPKGCATFKECICDFLQTYINYE